MHGLQKYKLSRLRLKESKNGEVVQIADSAMLLQTLTKATANARLTDKGLKRRWCSEPSDQDLQRSGQTDRLGGLITERENNDKIYDSCSARAKRNVHFVIHFYKLKFTKMHNERYWRSTHW